MMQDQDTAWMKDPEDPQSCLSTTRHSKWPPPPRLTTQIFDAFLTSTVREILTSQDKCHDLVIRCLTNLNSLIRKSHWGGCHLYHSTTNLTKHSEYWRPLYLPDRLPFHVRHLGCGIKHCMCWISNFNRNITHHFINRSVLPLISAHNNVQILNSRPVRGALLTVFTLDLNKHEHRNVTWTAWSNKIKMKVSPPFYSMITRNCWDYSHCKNISQAVRFDPTTIWSTEQYGSPSVNMLLYYKQALRTQHLFDWQLYSSAVRLTSSRELLGMCRCARFLSLVKAVASISKRYELRQCTVLLIDSSHRSLVCRKTTCSFINTDAKQTKLALKMEMIQSFETSVTVLPGDTEWNLGIPESQKYHCGNLRQHTYSHQSLNYC